LGFPTVVMRRMSKGRPVGYQLASALVCQGHAQVDADLGSGAQAVAGVPPWCIEVPQLEGPSLQGISRGGMYVPTSRVDGSASI
jgi:hypothetical protein